MNTDAAMEGRRIVVTGAASGIGRAVTDLLRSQGVEVRGLDLREDRREAIVGCDLADPASIDRAIDSLGPGWNGLCNVAGIPGTHPAERVIAVNFLGLRHLTERMLLGGLESGGAIVNVASTAGCLWQNNYDQARALVDTPDFTAGAQWLCSQPPGYLPYNLSKEAVIIYTMTLCTRALRRGLRVNAVSPGPVETPILPDFEESMGKAMLDWARSVTGRHGQASDIAGVVAALVHPSTAWVNGSNIVADGGFLAAVTTGTLS